ncbi:hypothetical protein G6F43_002572 [Rhizopus delemar]|nr:hypothetical protein G6F43_002572 [Rhizopus delemar]
MLHTRAVPWINQEEFETVYKWLFADRKQHVETIRRALDRIQAWSSRGRIPFSVEITGMLIESILRDERFGETMSHKELRLLYSMTLVRFVNGLVDQEQKGKYAKTVLTIAKSIGLPPWYVDLRHESTHERLPSLIVLRGAAVQAVAWLHDHYWIHNLNRAEEDDEEKSVKDVKLKLNMYKERRKAYVKGEKQDPTIYVDCIEALIKIIDEDIIKEDIIPLLLGTGGLVPTAKKKRVTAENMSISNDLIQIWTPLLKGLGVGYPSFASDLVSSLIQKLCSTDEYKLDEQLINPYAVFTKKEVDDSTQSLSYMLTLTCWLKHIVSEFAKPAQERTLRNLDIDDVLEGCLKNPNYYTRSVLQHLCQIDPELAESIKPFMRYIDQLLIKSTVGKRKEPDSLETIDEEVLENELKELESQLIDIKSNQRPLKKQKVFNIESWKLHENWRPCPIGMLPNGKMPCLDMRELLKK